MKFKIEGEKTYLEICKWVINIKTREMRVTKLGAGLSNGKEGCCGEKPCREVFGAQEAPILDRQLL